MKIDIHAHVIDSRYCPARRDGYTMLWSRESMFDLDARFEPIWKRLDTLGCAASAGI
jgi:hypothetical protein